MAQPASSLPATSVAASALAKSAMFGALSESARLKLAERGTEVRLRAGELMMGKGEPGDAVFVLIEGECEVGIATEGGRNVRLAAIKPGAIIGEFAVIDGEPRAADVTAVRRSRAIKISRAAILDALQAEPKALLALAASLIARLRATNDEVESHALLDLAAKLAKLLLDETENGVRLCQITQGEMARRIYVSREKLNRKLSEWRESGLVEVTRAGVRILDAAALAAFVRRRKTD